jgi:hypothetical protein
MAPALMIGSNLDCRRRVAERQARRQPIDPTRLRELAANSDIKSGDIARMFGYGRAAFFARLSADPRLWDIYAQARAIAGFDVLRARPSEWRKHRRGDLDIDEAVIVALIRRGCRQFNELRATAIASGIDEARFDAVLYNLEHEKHEIWSVNSLTFFLREEEAAE